MKELMFVLLGIGIWQLIVFIAILVTNEDEEKVFSLGIGIVGWFLYGIMFIIAKMTNEKLNKNN